MCMAIYSGHTFFICLCVYFSDECLFASLFFLTVILFCTTFSSSSSSSLSSSSVPAPPSSPPFSLLDCLSASQAGILLMKEDCMCNVVILAFISLHSTEAEAEGLPTRRDSFLPHLHMASWERGPHLRSPTQLPACLLCIANQIPSHSCRQPLPIALNQEWMWQILWKATVLLTEPDVCSYGDPLCISSSPSNLTFTMFDSLFSYIVDFPGVPISYKNEMYISFCNSPSCFWVTMAGEEGNIVLSFVLQIASQNGP